MNKRAFLGLIIIAVIVFVIITGTSVYFKFKEGGLQISAGNTVLDVNYNVSKQTNSSNFSSDSVEENITTQENQTGDFDSSISIEDEINQTSDST